MLNSFGRIDTDYVRTYPVFMNLTLSVDDGLVERAREVARQQGKSLNAVIREFLERLAGMQGGAASADELLALMCKQGGHSRGKKISREDAYRRR